MRYRAASLKYASAGGAASDCLSAVDAATSTGGAASCGVAAPGGGAGGRSAPRLRALPLAAAGGGTTDAEAAAPVAEGVAAVPAAVTAVAVDDAGDSDDATPGADTAPAGSCCIASAWLRLMSARSSYTCACMAQLRLERPSLLGDPPTRPRPGDRRCRLASESTAVADSSSMLPCMSPRRASRPRVSAAASDSCPAAVRSPPPPRRANAKSTPQPSRPSRPSSSSSASKLNNSAHFCSSWTRHCSPSTLPLPPLPPPRWLSAGASSYSELSLLARTRWRDVRSCEAYLQHKQGWHAMLLVRGACTRMHMRGSDTTNAPVAQHRHHVRPLGAALLVNRKR